MPDIYISVDFVFLCRCECGPFHQGDLCDVLIDNPCSMSPCVNGECITSEEQPNGYQCTCKEGFYGFTCDVGKNDKP